MPKPRDPGTLREWVELLRPTVQERGDTFGDRPPAWSVFRGTWAAFAAQSAREIVQSQQVQGQLTAVVTIRAIEGITSGFRVQRKGRIYELTGPPIEVLEEGRLEYLDLPVIETEHATGE